LVPRPAWALARTCGVRRACEKSGACTRHRGACRRWCFGSALAKFSPDARLLSSACGVPEILAGSSCASSAPSTWMRVLRFRPARISGRMAVRSSGTRSPPPASRTRPHLHARRPITVEVDRLSTTNRAPAFPGRSTLSTDRDQTAGPEAESAL